MAAPAAQQQHAHDRVHLTNEQAEVVHRVVHGRESIFLQGSAGTGKSAVFYTIRSEAAKVPGCIVGATASTGIAGTHINGRTVHSFLGLGIGSKPAQVVARNIMNSFYLKDTLANCRQTRILAIDEISMISAKLFEYMDTVLRIVRGINMPMGGMQLFAMGDFSQLPPAIEGWQTDKRLAFQSPLWQQIFPPKQCIRLTKIFRQTDERFVALLENLRTGTMSEASEETVKTVDRPLPPLHGIEPTVLMCKRIEVDQYNAERLQKLVAVPEQHDAVDTDANDVNDPSTGKPRPKSPEQQKAFEKLFQAPKTLTLKVGAQLMLLINFDPARGQVNGSRCVCTALHEDSTATVCFTDGQVVRFVPFLFEAAVMGKIVATRKQLPLTLAWASTVHKAQGMTLDYVSIDLSNAFETGQVYTAVSRAKTLDGMEIKGGIPRGRLVADPRVIAFERDGIVPAVGPPPAAASTANVRKEPPAAAASSAPAKTSPHFPPSAAAASSTGGPTKKPRL